MGKKISYLTAATLVSACVIVFAQSQPKTGRIAQDSQTKEFPSKLRTLKDLQLLGSHLTMLERLEWQMKWFVEESLAPSKTSVGLGGGPIDSGYIKQQLIRSMAGGGDARALKWLDKTRALRDPRAALAVKLALGIRGDESQLDRLMQALERDGDPNIRVLAAFGLATIASPKSRDVLSHALNDPYYVNFVGKDDPATRTYPVRDMVKGALRILDSFEAQDYEASVREKLKEDLQSYETFVRVNADALARIAVIGNRLVKEGRSETMTNR